MGIYEFGDKSSNIVLIQPVDEQQLDVMSFEVGEIKRLSGKDFKLAAFPVGNWNKALSPWKAPAVFGNDDFGDEAQNTLDAILKYCDDSEKTYYLGGYSLAGLFSLWTAYRTGLFKGVAAVSPSMWFPGFDDYMKDNEIRCDNIYLSLGDKEEKARNPVMATVGDRIREAETLLKQQNVNCYLEWNESNHFKEPDVRISKGFSWVINQ
ncbi:MAG: esterase [Butyrivibrio sp.]|nr:esterase [Butyrivibrio sp.]